MSIITLTTDWYANDFYVGAVKGYLLSNSPGCSIIDITHHITPHSITQAGFVIKQASALYPPKTVHIIGVSAQLKKNSPHIIIRDHGQYFIGTDNGMWGIVFDQGPPEQVIRLDDTKNGEMGSFPELSVFAPAAAKLASGCAIEELGEEYYDLKLYYPHLPFYDDKKISGSVIYIDSHKNIITNITKELFEQVRKGREFAIYIRSQRNSIRRINKYYHETTDGELLAVFNSLGLLEIAQNKAHVAEMLDIEHNATVRIDFED